MVHGQSAWQLWYVIQMLCLICTSNNTSTHPSSHQPNAFIVTMPDLEVRWYQNRMFIKLTTESCPPLALFLDDGKGNAHWNRSQKAVEKQGYYIELHKKTTACERYAVVEIDALLWLLTQRNRRATGAHIPSQKADERLLQQWQHWTRQACAFFTASKLGTSSRTNAPQQQGWWCGRGRVQGQCVASKCHCRRPGSPSLLS